MNKSANRKIRVVKKRITRLTRVTKKVYDKSVSKFFRIRCKLCKEEAGKKHLKICGKVNSMIKKNDKNARIHAIGDLFDSKD